MGTNVLTFRIWRSNWWTYITRGTQLNINLLPFWIRKGLTLLTTVLNLISNSTLFSLKPAVYCSLSYYHNKLRTHKHSNAVTKEHRVDRAPRYVLLNNAVYNNWTSKWLCKIFSANNLSLLSRKYFTNRSRYNAK